MTSAEFFNELVSMALNTKIYSELSTRDNIIAFLNIAECDLSAKLIGEFQKRYSEGFDDGHKAGLKTGCNEGYNSGYKVGYNRGYIAGNNDGYYEGHSEG